MLHNFSLAPTNRFALICLLKPELRFAMILLNSIHQLEKCGNWNWKVFYGSESLNDVAAQSLTTQPRLNMVMLQHSARWNPMLQIEMIVTIKGWAAAPSLRIRRRDCDEPGAAKREAHDAWSCMHRCSNDRTTNKLRASVQNADSQRQGKLKLELELHAAATITKNICSRNDT